MKRTKFIITISFFVFLIFSCADQKQPINNEFGKLIGQLTSNKETVEDLMQMVNTGYQTNPAGVKDVKMWYVRVKSKQNGLINRMIADINTGNVSQNGYQSAVNELNNDFNLN